MYQVIRYAVDNPLSATPLPQPKIEGHFTIREDAESLAASLERIEREASVRWFVYSVEEA